MAETEPDLAPPTPEPPLATPAGMERVGFPAMGTTVSLLLPVAAASAGADAVRLLFARWENTLSRFQPQSELSYLNRQAGAPVVVSPLLCDVIVTALAAAEVTGGLYDPTLLRQLVRLGYDRSFDDLERSMPARQVAAAPGGGWRRIVVDRLERRVTLPAGVGLDLGGIAKGMAVDGGLAELRALGITPALVNAGGDLAVLGTPPGGDAWSIAVPGVAGHWTLPLRRGALATSGIARRHWQQGEARRHHLLDPRTGLPAPRGLWSVSVVAARCAQAEAAATAAFILGAAAGTRFLQQHGLAGLVIEEDGRGHALGPWVRHTPG